MTYQEQLIAYPLTGKTLEVFNEIQQLGGPAIQHLLVKLMGTDAQHITITVDSKGTTLSVHSCDRIMAQDALDQQAWEEECERQRDYYSETV